jgi:hypothetical protein
VAKLSFLMASLFTALAVCTSLASAQGQCSTETVNKDCTVTIDRSYPVGLPTIQMRPGAKVKVEITNPIPFESLSLDLQTGQALVGTDQTAAFVAAAVPNLKGLLMQTQIQAAAIQSEGAEMTHRFGFSQSTATDLKPYKDAIAKLKLSMDRLLPDTASFLKNAIEVYEQLNEVLGTIPPQVLHPDKPLQPLENEIKRLPGSIVSGNVPRAWIGAEYEDWRNWMGYELVGASYFKTPKPSFSGLLGDGVKLATALGPCPTATPDSDIISCQSAKLQTAISKVTDPVLQRVISSLLDALNAESAVLSADSAAIVAINKDLGNYYVNIELASPNSVPNPLGTIVDPRDVPNGRNTKLEKFLGRQVVYAVNAVNDVGTSVAAVPTAAQKKSFVTITVLYADPRFEVSAGAIVSTLPNRSFANQTIVTQNPGSVPTQGNVVIAQTIARPTVVIFAGANIRLGHDFAWRFDRRRGAFYFTGTVGLNVNNTAAEFGFGPSVSWRSLMFSVLYDWGHDVRLTQGEYVGMIWCNQTAANGSIPKCSGAPPAPSTEKYWKGVVGFGISVRVPSVFGGGGASATSSGGGH